jgi:hypothetical protein
MRTQLWRSPGAISCRDIPLEIRHHAGTLPVRTGAVPDL